MKALTKNKEQPTTMTTEAEYRDLLQMQIADLQGHLAAERAARAELEEELTLEKEPEPTRSETIVNSVKDKRLDVTESNRLFAEFLHSKTQETIEANPHLARRNR